MHDISRVPEHVHVAACMEGWTLVVSQLQGAPALAELHRRLFAATGLPFLGTHIGAWWLQFGWGRCQVLPSAKGCQGSCSRTKQHKHCHTPGLGGGINAYLTPPGVLPVLGPEFEIITKALALVTECYILHLVGLNSIAIKSVSFSA